MNAIELRARKAAHKDKSPDHNTNKFLSDLLPAQLASIQHMYQTDPNAVMKTWESLLDEHTRTQTTPVSYCDGILTVRVHSSTLYSLLRQYERPRLIQAMQKRFPRLRNIFFLYM